MSYSSPTNQLVKADFEVARDGLRFPGALGGDLRKHGVEGSLYQELFRRRTVCQRIAGRRVRRLWCNRQVEEDGGLLAGKAEG